MTSRYGNSGADKLLQDFSQHTDNPYIFATAKPFETKSTSQALRRPHEEEVLREQRLTFFENDQTMQAMFSHDFDGYNAALDNPDLLVKRLEEQMQAWEHELQTIEADLPVWWQDEFWGDEFLDEAELLAMDFEASESAADWEDDWEPDWQSDPLYQKADKWARRILAVGEPIYNEAQRPDPDLFRVLANIFLVPAKIVYATSLETPTDSSRMEAEIGLHGYTLCTIFLQRVRQSLAKLIDKKFTPILEWRAALLAAEELSLDIQGRMIELAKKLRKS